MMIPALKRIRETSAHAKSIYESQLGPEYVRCRTLLEDFFDGLEIDEKELRSAAEWFRDRENSYYLNFLASKQWKVLEGLCADPHVGGTISLDADKKK